MNLNFENNKSGNGGFIVLKNNSDDIGRLTYTIVPELKILIISYVMIFPKYEGQGFGKKLVEKSIEFASENQWKIKAQCSYAHAVLNRKGGLEDILMP